MAAHSTVVNLGQWSEVNNSGGRLGIGKSSLEGLVSHGSGGRRLGRQLCAGTLRISWSTQGDLGTSRAGYPGVCLCTLWLPRVQGTWCRLHKAVETLSGFPFCFEDFGKLMWFYIWPSTMWLVLPEGPVAVVWEDHVSVSEVRCVPDCCRGEVVWAKDVAVARRKSRRRRVHLGAEVCRTLWRLAAEGCGENRCWGYLSPESGGCSHTPGSSVVSGVSCHWYYQVRTGLELETQKRVPN